MSNTVPAIKKQSDLSQAIVKAPLSIKIAGGAAMIAGSYFLPKILFGVFLSGLGIIGILITTIVTIGLLSYSKVLLQKKDNIILEARKAEARRRPIEQKQMKIINDEKILNKLDAHLITVSANIKALSDKIKKNQGSGIDTSKAEESLQAMKKYYEKKCQILDVRKKDLEKAKSQLDQDKFNYEFGTSVAELMKDIDGQGYESEILDEEASGEIDKMFNTGMATLEMELRNDNLVKH